MNTIRRTCNTAIIVLVLLGLGTVGTALVRAEEPGDTGEPTVAAEGMSENAAICFSVAAVVGISCVSAGFAVGKVGAAALGAAAEKPELLGRALIFVGLAEGIAIYGLIIGIMLIMKL